MLTRMSPYLNNHATVVPLQMKWNLRSEITLGNDLLLENSCYVEVWILRPLVLI